MNGRIFAYPNGSHFVRNTESESNRMCSVETTSDNYGRRFSLTGRGTDLGDSMSAQYSFDTMKQVKEVMRRREYLPALRVLPKTQLLAQLLVQEQAERDLFTHQEKMLRQQMLHKRDEERMKKEEQRLQQKNRERVDELKKKQAEELAALKEEVTTFQKQIDGEVREKLRLVCMMQPRMSVAASVLAEIKNERSPCMLLPGLIEEEKRVLKALRAESRHSKTSSDCGAVPHWMRACVVSSFNVAAILQDAPYRATVEDAIKVPSASLRKVVVVRNIGDRDIVAWANVRAGSDPVALATELAHLPPPEGLAAKLNCGVIWPKEDVAELSRKAKTTTDPEVQRLLQSVAGVSSSVMSAAGLTTHEFTKKDVEAIGSLATV